MGSNPSEYKSKKLPVETVSWDDCQVFITKLNGLLGVAPTGFKFRLPTEAQWEYACRAGTTTALNSGNDMTYSSLDALGWFNGNSDSKTHKVGLKIPNSWGLYDMHGNVWEWCSDRYGDYPSGSVTDPVGPPSGSYRVHRGGGFFSYTKFCRSAGRNGRGPLYRDYYLGVRLSLVSE